MNAAVYDSELDTGYDTESDADPDSGTAPVSGQAMALGATYASLAMSTVQRPSANNQNALLAQGQPTDPVITMEHGAAVVGSFAAQTARLAVPAMRGEASDYEMDPGRLVVQYEGGDASEREAFVGKDPVNASNQVLSFLLRSANVRKVDGTVYKGRVQLSAYATKAVQSRELRLRTRMFLSTDFDVLRSYPRAFRWLTISEWWNNAGWTGEAFPFRISVDIVKPASAVGSALYFSVRAEALNVALRKWDRRIWAKTNTTVPVPVGQWVTLEYVFQEGDAQKGRFYMALHPEGGERVVIFDQRGWTHHPDDPAPDGISHLNPIKLYTSKALIDHVRAGGGALAVHWDDIGFRLCRNHAASGSSPCAPESFL